MKKRVRGDDCRNNDSWLSSRRGRKAEDDGDEVGFELDPYTEKFCGT